MTLKFLSKLILVTMVLYLNVTRIYAQHSTTEPCGFDHAHKERLLNDPIYRQRTEDFENEVQKFKLSQKTTSTNYIIPVVVHVMQDGSSLTDISEQQIQDAINELNERYRKIPGGLGDGNGVDVTVEFSLAVRTPDNQCTNGIVFYNLSNNSTYVNYGVNRNNSNGIDEAVIKSYSVWDQTKYYNIWLVNQIDANGGGSGVQGFAYFASAHGSSIDGSLILANKFVTSGNTTAAHEIGHALNLYHTFEGDNGGGSCPINNNCSSDGDLVCDTPPHKRSSSDCVVGTNSCDNNSSTELFIHNYMDYSQDVCQSEFTAGQQTRMLAALNIQRSSLLASNGNMSLVPVETPSLDFTTTASYICTNASLYFTDRSSCIPNSYVNSNSFAGISHSWLVTNGNVSLTSTDQNPTFQFTSTGTYDVTLTLTTSFGTQTLTKKGFVVVGNAPTSSCSPSTTNTGNFWQTISNVTLNGINNSSNQYVNDGYSDYTCSASTILEAGETYSISVSGNAYQGDEIIEAYIDYNNNGSFDSGELISSGSITNGGSGNVTNSFTVPGNATSDIPLRMRVIGEANEISANERSCSSAFFIGDVEDYTIFVSSKVASVSIAVSPSNSITYGDNVTFTSTPTNGGSNPSYIWYINGIAVNGQTSATFSSTTLVDGDIVSCQMISDLSGAIGSPATSNDIQMTVVGAPISDFTYDISKICVGESVTFTDASQLVPTSWSWTITGAANQSSTSQNPTLTFNTAGTYTVSLSTSNAYGNGTTKTFTDIINVYATPGAQCTNFSRSGPTGYGIGITNVSLESINYNSLADDVVYEDNVCSENVILEPNTQYNLSITVGNANAQWVYAYIDFNNNNSFTDNGELIFSTNSETGTINTTFTTPTSPNLNELLRMRVITDFAGATSPSPCTTTLGYGQVEDYGVIITQACSEPTQDAGEDGILSICANETVTENLLFNSLLGTPETGGTWSNNGNVYTYTLPSTGGCPDATAIVTVSEQAVPNAGSNGTLTICPGSSPSETELFDALGGNPDTGGFWVNSGSTYTYTVDATSPCSNPATSTVTVTEETAPNAGTNGSLTICQGNSPSETELFNALGGNPDNGGTWSNSGLVYTYTVTNQCLIEASSTVNITEETAPNAGTDGSLTICQGDTPSETELFDALGGTPDTGGNWSSSGTSYIYTVSGTAPCSNATSTVTINEQAPANAGTNGSLTICPGTTPSETQLFNALGGNPDMGGDWTNSGSTYTYTVYATSPCSSSASSTVTVTDETTPNSGTDGSLTICQGNTPSETELFNALGGNPDNGGTWANNGSFYTYTVSNQCLIEASSTVTITEETPPNAGTSGSLTVCDGTTPTNTELFNALGGNPDVGGSWSGSGSLYTYTVSGTAPCSNASSTVTVTEQAAPNAGNDATLMFCQGQQPSESDLFNALGGNPDTGGTWTNTGLIYTYTVSANSPCTTDATANVTLVEQNCAGLNEVDNNSILIFPNPSNGIFKINNIKDQIIVYSIYDASGKVLMKALLNEANELDLTSLNNGVYTIELKTTNQVSHHKLVIKH